ncbi:hypothetical protein PHYBLDRAFT_63304 [Phycomyces blakesleeanus NRRL 1555(-)]|uniref:Uncharacterized protein n=1 Tax=Phycomyces blakesleeanus (strain ATCC 8743b / DSM 1359 / FGSC 10004 / NBRC 33097 / NRRL 1555) TaxID=763407 RepID=A0A162ZSK9_PHYB8|nr:hypothetical protein PHYBLDRAFT_63304 [Phycomyces blakesleeanus NRRL 1555(-)]OAD68791.1 hypothetical protein PHYBLDRAFT_63304 [Phycomyces blakesleeanus NRRL 1555(-)]|eukprot:XP_018286831.1 hypothetical protein PHYBLDRAFT_63304 [Phycomyces blakesleeanus NRRL 1555(-)]
MSSQPSGSSSERIVVNWLTGQVNYDQWKRKPANAIIKATLCSEIQSILISNGITHESIHNIQGQIAHLHKNYKQRKGRAMFVYFNELDPSFLNDTDVEHVLNVRSGHASMTVLNLMHQEHENVEVAEDDDETGEESKDKDDKEIEEVDRQVVARYLSAATTVGNNCPSKRAHTNIDKSLFEFMKRSSDLERKKIERVERQLKFETKIQSRWLEIEERQIVVKEKNAEICKRKLDLDEREIALEQDKIQIDKSRTQIQHAEMLKGL